MFVFLELFSSLSVNCQLIRNFTYEMCIPQNAGYCPSKCRLDFHKICKIWLTLLVLDFSQQICNLFGLYDIDM